MINFEKTFYHYTTAGSAFKILESEKFFPSKVLTCNDPFEMDNSPLYIEIKNENQFIRYCQEIFKLCRKNAPLLEHLQTHIKNENDKDALMKIINIQRKNFGLKDPVEKSIVTLPYLPLDNVKNKSNIYCFSVADVRSAIPLWSHYADRHKGIALGFSFKDTEFNNRIFEVKYPPKNVRGGVFSLDELIRSYGIDFQKHEKTWSNIIELFAKTALTKHFDWKYEQEWRMIDTNDTTSYLPINDTLIRSIHFGLQISDDDKEKLINLIKHQYQKTKIFIPNKKDDKYIKINFNELLFFDKTLESIMSQ